MTKKKQTDNLESFDINRELLKSFYQDAKEESEMLWPDAAIKRLSKLMGEVLEREKGSFAEAVLKNPKLDPAAHARELHHYAVDLFYDTYCGKQTGPPRLHPQYLKQIVMLREKGLSYGQIAKKLGLATSPPSELKRSTDRIRKQLDEAEERGITSSGKRHI
jgi:hypothetical protein